MRSVRVSPAASNLTVDGSIPSRLVVLHDRDQPVVQSLELVLALMSEHNRVRVRGGRPSAQLRRYHTAETDGQPAIRHSAGLLELHTGYRLQRDAARLVHHQSAALRDQPRVGDDQVVTLGNDRAVIPLALHGTIMLRRRGLWESELGVDDRLIEAR
jgi:hypothetical protein